MNQKYDAVIIGAGMSGLAAGIRLSMYGKKVVILEKHIISGGLNSYYARGKRKFDVGLHAMTNYVPKGTKAKPLTKLLKQLRIKHDELNLSEQSHSLIKFKSESLIFTNDFKVLQEEIAIKFPHEIDNFNRFVEYIKDFNEVSLSNETFMAKDVAKNYLKDSLLIEMIFAPLLIYGSAWENDMDFSQFVIMFKSIYMEGFCRPDGGVRTVLNILLDKYKEVGGELRYKSEVVKINHHNNKVHSLQLKNGEVLETMKIISSMGHPETMSITSQDQVLPTQIEIGPLSFCESILCLDKLPKSMNINETIIFYNDSDIYEYKKPNTLYDNRSGVICFPNNFKNDTSDEGIARITYMANYDLWKSLERKDYLLRKEQMALDSYQTIKACHPQFNANIVFKDIFTPTTIERYTGHFKGCVYGSTQKVRNGQSSIDGLIICGTDQGFLGIVGAMLSGISMANLYGLMESN